MSRFRRSILAVLLVAMVTLAPFGVRVGYGAAIRPVEGGRAGHLPVIGGPAPRHSRIEKQLRALHGSSGIAKGDFNGDGFGDLAIGIPDLDVNGKEDAGGVLIIYGSTRGLTATSRNVLFSQLFTEATPNLSFLGRNFGAAAGDQFGTALASGDFDGNGRSDLAIGVPGKDLASESGPKDSGAVYIIYGTSTGLDPKFIPGQEFQGLRYFDYGDFQSVHGGEALGSSLAWGNFINLGNSFLVGDLAIGAPGARVTSTCVQSPTFEDAGQVWVMEGTENGEDHRGIRGRPRLFDETSVQNCGQIESIDITGNHFGAALAAGNFDGDETTVDQLAIGVPDHGFAFDDIPHGGVVYVMATNGAVVREITATKITGYGGSVPLPARGDRFGSVLAAGDINGDGAADLAIGVPDRDVGSHANAGVVSVRYGTLRTAQSDGGLTGAVELWTQDRIFPNDPENKSEEDDAFGAALAIGDLNGDGFADLAVGAPFEDIQLRNISGALITVKKAGEVDVIYGSPSRLSNTFRAPQIWSKNTTGIGGTPGDNELFGLTLTAWNFGKGRQADLAIGVPFEDLLVNRARVVDAGGVFVLYGSGRSAGDGLTATANQHWTPESAGLPGGAQPNEHFGRALY